MPHLFIHLRNAEFCSRDDGSDYATPEAALALGTRSAVDMASDEISRGRHSVAVVINVEQADGTRLLTSVVAISVSPLIVIDAVANEDP